MSAGTRVQTYVSGVVGTTVHIDGAPIGPDAPPYVIAEAGVNHNGDLDTAEALVDAAAAADSTARASRSGCAARAYT